MERSYSCHWCNYNEDPLQCCECTISSSRTSRHIDDNNVTVHTGKKLHIEKNGLLEQLHALGAHLHAAAIVPPGCHKPNQIKLDNSINSRYNPSKPTTLSDGEVEDISQQATIPKQLRQPPQPTKQDQEQHRITHMPYRSWCPICVKAKGHSVHHRHGGLKEQSLIQLDHAYTRSSWPTNKKWQAHAILTCVETITGLCMAIPTSRKSPTRHQLTLLKKFVMENGFGQSIIQVDNDPAI
eukprot:6491346-Amphidinium_carterae.1